MANDIEPLPGLVAVRSLEDEDEERGEGAYDSDSHFAEMAEVCGVSKTSVLRVGEVVFIRPAAFHLATHIDAETLIVSEGDVVAKAMQPEDE